MVSEQQKIDLDLLAVRKRRIDAIQGLVSKARALADDLEKDWHSDLDTYYDTYLDNPESKP